MLACTLPCAAPAQAERFKDTLKERVREGVERSKDDDEPKKRKRREPELERKPGPEPEPGPERGPEPGPGPLPGPALPIRVFGDDLRLDLSAGIGYRGWIPQPYDLVDVEFGSYLTWNVDVKAKLFRFLVLRRGYYESNGAAAPRTEEAAVAAEIGTYVPKAVWLLGAIGIPISRVFEPQIRYEARAFETRARPEGPVCLVDRDAPEDAEAECPGRTTGELKIISSFETLVAGVRYDASKRESSVVTQQGQRTPPLFFGIGLMQYRKPYQLNFDDYTVQQYLFDARFRGAGLALGLEIIGGINQIFAEVDAQLGLGEVSLTEQITLNELVPNDELIGYVHGTATLGFRWAMLEGPPTLILVPVVKAGGASFFLVGTDADEEQVQSPTVNWDFLWTLQASLLIPL